MTEQECIEWMEYLGNMKLAYDRNPNKRRIACDVAIKALEEIQQYRALGTVEELRVARDKQVAKKPKGIDSDICPNCGTYNSVILQRRNTVGFDTVYCWHCGTAIECEV